MKMMALSNNKILTQQSWWEIGNWLVDIDYLLDSLINIDCYFNWFRWIIFSLKDKFW
jgi:hypothetical protein